MILGAGKTVPVEPAADGPRPHDQFDRVIAVKVPREKIEREVLTAAKLQKARHERRRDEFAVGKGADVTGARAADRERRITFLYLSRTGLVEAEIIVVAA